VSAPGDPVAALERTFEAVDRWEPHVHAYAHLDRDRARREATTRRGPLAGVVLGVKDIFDTADQPTEYGSPIHRGHRPGADAAAVALLRAAGATVSGKTVTAELACSAPGPTVNPHRVTHTPGGSSSGSAAAIATGMADLALGTQTAGSVVRPASFCGVFGFKPTFGTVATAGMKPVAPSLDTVGWFARDVALLDTARVALTGRPCMRSLDEAPAIALVRTAAWDVVDADARAAVLDAARCASDAGASVVEVDLGPMFDALADDHWIVASYESWRALAWERVHHSDLLSQGLREMLDRGGALDPGRYDDVLARSRVARAELAGRRDVDVVLTLAATGEAPEGLQTTGDPRAARLWTLLGVPVLAVPGLVGATGLPIGIQLVGRAGRDADLLAAAEWLARVLPPAPRPPTPG
jgi:Asp-tRNA(Asn)/Glu-tRNA(Gln) amidotransferase A subunit family amidase